MHHGVLAEGVAASLRSAGDLAEQLRRCLRLIAAPATTAWGRA